MTRTTRPDPIALWKLDHIAKHVPAVLGPGIAETFERVVYSELKAELKRRDDARSKATAHALDQFEANFRVAIREPLRSFVAALVEAGVLDKDERPAESQLVQS